MAQTTWSFTILSGAQGEADPFCTLFPSLSRPQWMCSPGCEMKIIDGPSASEYSLPFPLCAPFMGILKAIKYDHSAISSRLNFPIIALNHSYFFRLGLFLPPGVHMDSDVLVHIMLVMRVPWSPLRWHSDPNELIYGERGCKFPLGILKKSWIAITNLRKRSGLLLQM